MIGPIRTTVTFDGYRISDDFLVSRISRPRPIQAAETVTPGGARGGILSRVRTDPVTIELGLVAEGDYTRRGAALDRLMAALSADTPRELRFGDDSGRYYLAVPSGGGAVTPYFWGDEITVQLIAPDPARYGALRTVSVPAGASTSAMVGGNSYAMPAIAGTSSGTWRVTVDGAEYVEVSGSGAVSVDCEARTATVAGTLALPTIGSDWIRLEPGRHSVAAGSGGPATLTWRERWL